MQSLVISDQNIGSFVDGTTLQSAHRLGISYEGVPWKFLISYDIEEEIKEAALAGDLSYDLAVEHLDKDYSRITFSVHELNYQKEFYFKGELLVSPISYHTRYWTRIESKHFLFFISDTTLFNSYCIENLERFFVDIAELLQYDDVDLETIEAHKIHYCICRDEDEIFTLTGFHARGMFNLAYDCIVTTFNAHYHELLHLLINFKLKALPLHTHPFLQEGFAVAFGGRGGKEPHVVLDLGLFLYKSKMLDYDDLLTKEGFHQYDASLSYPACGLYNYFLVDSWGLERYLQVYRLYSATAESVGMMHIPSEELPGDAEWHTFLEDYAHRTVIDLHPSEVPTRLIYDDGRSRIYENTHGYYFNVSDTLLISTAETHNYYRSTRFHEFFNHARYRSQKYLIIAGPNEISIYNLFTNNLIASFVSSFAIPFENVPTSGGFYNFLVQKDVFDDNVAETRGDR